MTTIQLSGAGATRALGRRLGAAVRPGDVLLLEGPLGAGKTVIVQGVAQGLDCDDAATSPTFVLVRHHQGRLPLVHADLYRIENPGDAERLGLLELAEAGILAVEWPERCPQLAVPGAARLHLAPSPAEADGRILEVEAIPAHLAAVLEPRA